jgi:hypothetical protein
MYIFILILCTIILGFKVFYNHISKVFKNLTKLGFVRKFLLRLIRQIDPRWSLHPDEISLLADLLAADQFCHLRDYPVFLPVKSPTVSSKTCLTTPIPRSQTWGRCYDHNFLRFSSIFCTKMAFFSKRLF